MPPQSIFRTNFSKPPIPPNPESLFHTLRERSDEIKHLWSHQADVIRVYHRDHINTPDVAIELPTGAGKTLVALLIAEWRRQTHSERVAYLCPTRQLARQVNEQATHYGIPTDVLVGSQRDYPPKSFHNYQTSHSIAITTYSGIFNIHPRLGDAQMLILDDAHAGENYISSMWSLELARSKDPDLYSQLLNLFRHDLGESVYDDLSRDQRQPESASIIELVPGPLFRSRCPAIKDLLNAHLEHGTSPHYTWNTIKNNLAACNVFVSWDAFLIRPIIPPALVHDAYSTPKQRLYMSATLGAGGDLERIAGVKHIKRIPLPGGWEKHGNGRRLFLMPNLSLSDRDVLAVIRTAVRSAGRALLLVPNQHDTVGATVLSALKDDSIPVISANDIEDSMGTFVDSDNSVLMLARYDGLDLPDETCRCVIIAGLPSGTNLQERFLWSRLSAHSLLRDRVLTRLTQGAGRCTRSDRDYSLVLVVGRKLVEFVTRAETRRILNSDLQAEITFGIENSRDVEKSGFESLWRAFLDQGDEWSEAEEAIQALRRDSHRDPDAVAGLLKSGVADEVCYLYAIWQGHYERAFECARKVADGLGGDETKAYRAWWYYLSADAAMALYEAGDATYRNVAQDFLTRATNCSFGIRWFARLGRTMSSQPTESLTDEMSATCVETIAQRLADWGLVGAQFESKIRDIHRDLRSTEYRAFHRGLAGLGEMLGFQTCVPSTDAAPDCIWHIDRFLYVSHEAKSEHTPDDPIGANDVRQAMSHGTWVRAKFPCDSKTTIVCLINSPRTTVSREAVTHAGSLYHVTLKEINCIFDEVAAVLRRIRSKCLPEETMRDELYVEFRQANLTPDMIASRLQRRLLSGMNVSG